MIAQVTEAHRKLVAAIIRDLSIDDGAQRIADSEARAVEPWRTQVEELRGALALGQENCDDVFDDLREERDQLRADLATEREKAERYRLVTLRQDAELAVERARLDWLAESWDSPLEINLHPSYGWSAASENLRVYIDAKMQEDAK